MYDVESRLAAIESFILSILGLVGSVVLFILGWETIALSALLIFYVSTLFNLFRIAHSTTRRLSFRFAITLDKFFESNQALLNHVIALLLVISSLVTFRMMGFGYLIIMKAVLIAGLFFLPGHYYKKQVTLKNKK